MTISPKDREEAVLYEVVPSPLPTDREEAAQILRKLAEVIETTNSYVTLWREHADTVASAIRIVLEGEP